MIPSKIKIGIIGGGPAGLATAIKLKQYHFDVFLFEASSYDKTVIGEHLAAEALHEFKKLGIPESLLKKHSIPCMEVQNAWGNSEIHYNESLFNPFGASYILSRPDFDKALFNYCDTLGIKIENKTRISKIKKTDDGWELHKNNKIINVHFLVDASGRNSKFNFDSKLKKQFKNQLIGMTKCFYESSKLPVKKNYLLVESTPFGWWYSVQIASGKTICTFMTDAKILTESKNSHNDFWDKQLTNSIHTKRRIHKMKDSNTIHIQSAHSHLSEQIIGQNSLKVGDAAQSFDPLSSAGIIKGLKMGQFVAEKIYNFFQGNKNSLQEYKDEVLTQYKTYLTAKKEFYSNEKRWMHFPFWYEKNLKVKSIQYFTITPQNKLIIIDKKPAKKILFLEKQLPEINFKQLINSIQKYPLLKIAIQHYLKEEKKSKISPWFIHAIESLKISKIIEQE